MLTPIDIHNRQLKPAKIGGYDKKDIDDFIEEVIASYEELYNENRVLKEKITSLSEGIQYYKKMEGTLQKALLLAEKTSTETQEAAKSQADSVLTEASAKAEALTRETKAEIDALRAEAQAQAEVTRAKANRELEETRNHVRKLVQSYENYRLQFKKLAEAQIEMLESDSFSIFVPELDELMKEAPSADNILDNPGVIPINIGSPAPFEEPPVENTSEAEPIPSSKPTPKPQPKVSVEPVAEAPKKLDVTFDDLSNSIAIPISSNMGPFTDLPAEDKEEGSAAVLQDLKIDSSTAPSIDINIGTAIGEEIEVSMSLDSPPDLNVGAESIDILVNTESLLNGAVEEIQADDSAVQPEAKPLVEPVAISASTPADETAAQAVEPSASIQPSFTDPDVIELAPESEINVPGTTEQSAVEPLSPESPVVTPANPFLDLGAAVPDSAQPVVTMPTESSDNSIAVDFGMSSEPQEMNIPLNFDTPTDISAEPQGMNIPLNLESPTEIPAEPQGMNIPLSFESPTDISAESQGMNIPLNFESPTDISAEPQGMNIPLNFESPTDISAESQGMNIPLSFESPTDISAEPQGTNIPISFESPDDLQTTEPQGIHIPIGFEMPDDLQNTDPQGMSLPLGFETPEDLQTTGPQNSPVTTGFEIPEEIQTTGPRNVDASLNFNMPQNNIQGEPAMPVMDIPMMETPMAETAPTSSNGILGGEPSSTEPSAANPMMDMSNFLDSPIKEIPEELQTAASKEFVEPAPSENGIITDAFLDPAAMFESPVSEEPVKQPEKQPTNANDAMLNINPFNFIDPE